MFSPGQAYERALSPQQRSAWVREQTAIDAERRAEAAYMAARNKLDNVLTQFDEATRPVPAWVLDDGGLRERPR